jgi:hypothetical protein
MPTCRLLAVLAVLACALWQPRVTLLAAVIAAGGTYAAVRLLLNHRTVFVPRRARWA